MTTGGRRDDAALEQGLSRWVSAHHELVPGPAGDEPPRIRSLTHAQGGQANETLLVDLGPRPGMVVRLPPSWPTFPDYDLGPQALLQNAMAASGVPAPAPALVVTDTDWIGTPFLVMPPRGR